MRYLNGDDQRQIRRVICEQLRDLSRLDGDRALGKMTPARRRGDGRAFLASITHVFPQLAQAWQAEFGDLGTVDGVPAQPVRVTAWNGSEIEAIYLLEQGQDGNWLIDRCVCRSSSDVRALMN
jgi:hypothetical protein